MYGYFCPPLKSLIKPKKALKSLYIIGCMVAWVGYFGFWPPKITTNTPKKWFKNQQPTQIGKLSLGFIIRCMVVWVGYFGLLATKISKTWPKNMLKVQLFGWITWAFNPKIPKNRPKCMVAWLGYFGLLYPKILKICQNYV